MNKLSELKIRISELMKIRYIKRGNFKILNETIQDKIDAYREQIKKLKSK